MKDETDHDTQDLINFYALEPVAKKLTGLARLPASPVGAVGQGAAIDNNMECQECGELLTFHLKGRTPRFCSSACRQASYRHRKNGYTRQRQSKRIQELQSKFHDRQRANERDAAMQTLTLRLNAGNANGR